MLGLRFDRIDVPPLIDNVELGTSVADKAFDSNDIIANLNNRGAKISPSPSTRAIPVPLDAEIYKYAT